MQNFIHIGKTHKTYGVKGEVKLHVEDKYLDDIEVLKVVFLKINGKEVPYFVDSLKMGSNILIKFEDINSPEEAHAVVSKEMYARVEDLTPLEESTADDVLAFSKYTGYTIIDEEKGRVGVISEVVEFPQQEMAVVNYQGREILIPLNNELILKEDQGAKKLTMALPEGLLEL